MTAFYYKMLSIRYLKPCLYEENSPGYPRLVFEVRDQYAMQANAILILCLYVYYKYHLDGAIVGC